MEVQLSMAKNNPGYYAVIPADVRYDDQLPPNAKLLYGEISALLNDEGYCFASNQYFADLFKVTTRTITDLIGKLQEQQHISVEIVRNDKGKVVRREIRCTVSMRHAHPVEENFYTPRKSFPEGIEKNFQYTNTSNTNLNVHNTPASSVTEEQPRQKDPFDIFWAAYPRKVDKKKARKAFEKVKVPVETLLSALEVQKQSPQWVKDGGAYIPHPTTWLNGERWADDVKAAPAPAPPAAAAAPDGPSPYRRL